ncbi:MAG: BBP7 family outer membrane beta-barrel protein [Planctomycetaceae bacterium]|nr:BBP7 family outer membrane beta-barrel protein [Planctomycetales bacterium]MCB9873485.1 BBP7 family outer membrane beta-barrel protein [Planctomycetaceae bacterium]MCB9940395.1 BBP7 family outer membrane beta-barrel protein [Planctomycetaceae bacterium]HRX78688.1 BBP7 family outer membrane beta-barrel protein [Pirellulaceae bacterium]
MSIRKLFGSFATIAALALLTPQIHAQHEIHRGMPLIDPDGDNPDLWQPFVDTTAFPHDFQFFAPAEFGEFGNGPEAPTGWFATADRVHIYVSRPRDEVTHTEGDFTWGNRFTLGYMSPEDHGWFGEYWNIDGPHAFNVTEAERVNVLNTSDTVNTIASDYVDLRNGTDVTVTDQNPGVPRSDQNNVISGDRRYFVRDSLNEAAITSFELNKSFRLKQLHYGSRFEPFFGFRYVSFQDYWERDTYARITDLGVNVGQVPPTTIDPTTLQNEQFDQLTSRFDNHMVGGQFGARWYKVKGRWNLSGELRAFLFSNFQFQQTTLHTELTFYDATGVDEPPEGVFLSNTLNSGNATEFVFGGEVRAEAAYELTRDISLRAGITFMDFGRGVGRGNDINRNDQNVVMFGTTFGFDYRR